MIIYSPEFEDGQLMPYASTGDGADLSPILLIKEIPEEAQAMALIMDAPDAPNGPWDLWLIYDFPTNLLSLPQGIPRIEYPAFGGAQGLNSWGRIGYLGPCPPWEQPGRYLIRAFALDKKLNLKAGLVKAQLMQALDGHVLAEAHMSAAYERQNVLGDLPKFLIYERVEGNPEIKLDGPEYPQGRPWVPDE